MEDTKSKIYLSWDITETLVDVLSNWVKKHQPQIDSVMGLPRGGLIPAVMLSHKLNLPLVFEPTEKTLIVDDICDSGETFIEIYNKYPNSPFACLHLKPHTTKFTPHIWAISWESDDWIVYPWENTNADAIQDYLK
jgi:hypoxanthine phosphoribosyltransferase